MSQQNLIAYAKGLNKSFAGKPALIDLDLEIHSGQVLAILGANGAGKTTLINILLGRLNNDSGDVNLFNAKAGSLEAKRLTGAMLQVANLPETLKIKEHIRLFQSYYPNPMPYEKVIAYAGLEDMQNRYSKKLSGGEKQRLLFALSICGNPRLLFLDEPSVGMDIESREKMWQAIRDLKSTGTSIVLTTHYLQEADSLADEILLLKDGKAVKRGTSEEVKASVNHTTIRFCTDLDAALFEGFEGVISCTKSGKYLEVHTNNASQSLQAILAEYPDLEDVTVERAGLEEAFKQLSQ